jgi:hypothetical protein
LFLVQPKLVSHVDVRRVDHAKGADCSIVRGLARGQCENCEEPGEDWSFHFLSHLKFGLCEVAGWVKLHFADACTKFYRRSCQRACSESGILELITLTSRSETLDLPVNDPCLLADPPRRIPDSLIGELPN